MAPKRSRESESSGETGLPSSSGVRSTKKPRLSVQGKPITAVVGDADEAAEFFLPEALLIQHSDFAKAALKTGWKETEERVIPLKEENPEIFEIFATFAHTGRIYSSKEGDRAEPAPAATELGEDSEWGRLVDCWILGDMMQSSSFKDATTDAIVQKVLGGGRHPLGLQKVAYVSTVGDNTFRRLVVDIAAFGWSKNCFRRDDYIASTSEFFRDVCVRLIDKTPDEEHPFVNCGCKYHEHGTEKPCYKTMF